MKYSWRNEATMHVSWVSQNSHFIPINPKFLSKFSTLIFHFLEIDYQFHRQIANVLAQIGFPVIACNRIANAFPHDFVYSTCTVYSVHTAAIPSHTMSCEQSQPEHCLLPKSNMLVFVRKPRTEINDELFYCASTRT